ncbi:MAG: thioesterase family protein [Acidimicrobiales bacterium]
MPLDVAFLGLTPSGPPGRFRFEVVEHLTRLDGKLYGGTAIAASVAAAVQTTDRSPLWMTTQFVSTVELGATVDLHAEVLAGGRRTNQVRVTGTSAAGEVIFASLGATGIHRPDGLTGAFERMPTVDPPEDAERWDSPITGLIRAAGFGDIPIPEATRGFGTALEMREPQVHEHPDQGPGRICLWVRRRDGEASSPGILAYVADVVPMGVAHAMGVVAGGTSLDNTIRFGPAAASEWLLLDVRPHLAISGYGHGIAHVWSGDGELLATASQTASMLQFDVSALAAMARSAGDDATA